MKVLSLGDTHGEPITLEIAKENFDKVDHIVFHGDYVDSFDSKWAKQKDTLEKIIEFKKEFPDKVTLLLGNHDIQYIGATICSGHQAVSYVDIQDFLNQHFDLFNAIEVIDKWIFSHAGVSEYWFNNKYGHISDVEYDDKTDPFENLEQINEHFRQKDFKCFNALGDNPYGIDRRESCFWIRPQALLTTPKLGYHQVVGHTELACDSESRVLTQRMMFKSNNISERSFIWKKNEKQLDYKLVLIDSPKRDVFSIVDTSDDSVEIFRALNEKSDG